MEKDMMYRFDQSEIISQGVTRRALSSIQKRINNKDIDINELRKLGFENMALANKIREERISAVKKLQKPPAKS